MSPRGRPALARCDRMATLIKRRMSVDVLTGVQKLQPIADGIGLTMAQLAIAWVLQNRNVVSAIIGVSRPDQVAASVKASGRRDQRRIPFGKRTPKPPPGAVVRAPLRVEQPLKRQTLDTLIHTADPTTTFHHCGWRRVAQQEDLQS